MSEVVPADTPVIRCGATPLGAKAGRYAQGTTSPLKGRATGERKIFPQKSMVFPFAEQTEGSGCVTRYLVSIIKGPERGPVTIVSIPR